MERKHEKYQRLIDRCSEIGPVPCAVAHPCDESSLRGALEAAQQKLLAPILVGPEGGFDDTERAAIRVLPQARPIGLGPRILRAETAAVAAMSAWMASVGDW